MSLAERLIYLARLRKEAAYQPQAGDSAWVHPTAHQGLGNMALVTPGTAAMNEPLQSFQRKYAQPAAAPAPMPAAPAAPAAPAPRGTPPVLPSTGQTPKRPVPPGSLS